MSDFGTMKARIASEMKRGELTASATAVQSSIISAIARLERKRFPWNEFNDTTLSASVTYAPFSTMAITPLVIDSVKAVIGSRDYPLTQRTFRELDNIDAGQFTGYPDYYAIHGGGGSGVTTGSLRLYPPPNATYVLKLSGIQKLTEISAGAATTATNAWMTDGEEMVRLLAKSMLFRDELRQPQLAGYFHTESERAAREISRETRAKQGSGKLVSRWL